MKNLPLKIYFLFKKPILFVVEKKNVLVLKMARFVAEKSKKDVFVLPLERTTPGHVLASQKSVFLVGEEKEKLKRISKKTENKSEFVSRKKELEALTFGFEETADVYCSDIKEKGEGTNFKLSFQGKIIPVWLKDQWSREEVLSALAVLALSLQAGLNIVHVSQVLKNFDKGRK